MKFEVKDLKECIELIIDHRGKTPKKLGGNWVQDGKYRALSAKNIKNLSLVNEESIKKIDEELYKKWMKVEIEKEDLLLTSEAPLGESLLWDSYEKIVLSQRLFAIRVNKTILYPKYFAAFVSSKYYQNELKSRASGSTVQGIRQTELLKTKVLIPQYKQQVFIGDLFYNINKKISLNVSIISNLEQLAQTLFKRWFVDFEFPNENGEPYKSSGGKMVQSELGEIPEGWKITSIFDVADVISGGTPKTKIEKYWNGSIPFYTPKDSSDRFYVHSTEKYITKLGLLNCNSKLFPKNTIIITARGTVGKINLINTEMAMNQSCYAIRHKNNYQYYLFLAIKRMAKQIIHNSIGAVFNAITIRDFKLFNIVKPHDEIIRKFETQVKYLFDLSSELTIENSKLKTLRDTLLPKLISGEIELPDESEVKEHVLV